MRLTQSYGAFFLLNNTRCFLS